MPPATRLREPSTVVDAALAMLLVTLGTVWIPAAWDLQGPVWAVVGVVAPLALVVVTAARRRRDPLPAAAALAASAVVVTWASGAEAWFSLGPAALFMVQAYEERGVLRLRITIAGFAALALTAAWTSDDWRVWAFDVVGLASVVGWAYGVRVRRLYQESLVRRAEAAERESDLRAAQAVAQERTRIARDIHDVVSHSLAVVAVQAGGAQRIADRDPERAKEALGVIADTARGALTEMRALLEVLRTGDPADGAGAPRPGLAEVDALVAGMAASGLLVDYEVTGAPFALGVGAELAVHRVIQESLTNAVKHGDRTVPVTVTLHYGPDELRATVINGLPTGTHGRDALPGSGSGLAGMRERLALYGGSLEAGPTGDRFEVRAHMPRAKQPEPEIGAPGNRAIPPLLDETQEDTR